LLSSPDVSKIRHFEYLVVGLFALLLFSRNLLLSSLSSPFNTLQHVGHGTTSIGAKDLDSDNLGLLCNTVTLRGNGASNMCSMTVTIFIFIASRDSRTPDGTTFKLFMVNIDTRVNNISYC
jgi:hypothetical protein